MKMSTIESRIAIWYAASLEDGGPSFHLMSKPGRGKTSIMRKAPQILERAFGDGKYGFSLINGANATLTTLCGYLWPVDKDGEKYSEFTKPYWWTTAEGLPLTAYVGGILLVDEEDKLGLDEKKIVGEGALSKVLGGHRLPDGWVVWMAGNYNTDRSGSTKQFDHLINRRNTIEVKDDIESLSQWMHENGCLAETVTFAEENPQIVFMDAPEKQGPWCTPRALVAQDKLLQSFKEISSSDQLPTDADVVEEIAGGIGMGAAAQLIATIKLGLELPPYEDIVAKSLTVAVPSKPDAKRLAMYKMGSRVSDKDVDKVLSYVGRFPQEFQVMFAKFTFARNKPLIMHPAVMKWCSDKAGLIALISRYDKAK